jgi:hypothetical protein
MLIKLTGVPHPDLNGGKPQPVYIDASRVLLIIQGHHQYPKIGAVEANQDMLQALWAGVNRLTDKVNGYVPEMHDPVAVKWMTEARSAAQQVSSAYADVRNAAGQIAYHPRVDCTEVQLACGTALEHGVMLTRVWVSETPEEVAEAVTKRLSPTTCWKCGMVAQPTQSIICHATDGCGFLVPKP